MNLDQKNMAARSLKAKYGDRDQRMEDNLNAYNGDFDLIVGTPQGNPYRDNYHDRMGSGTQVWNLMYPIVNTSMMQLAQLPSIFVPAPQPADTVASSFADRLEKMYYALFDASDMHKGHAEIAFNLPTFGSSVEMVLPDPDLEIPIIRVRDPRTCYPQPGRRLGEFAFVTFQWTQETDEFLRQYPQAESLIPRSGGNFDKKVEVVEWIDDKDYGLIIGGKWMSLVEGGSHNLGFVPVVVTSTLSIPGRIFGPSDIDQLVGRNIDLNLLETMTADALKEGMFQPTNIFSDEEPPYDRAAGAVNYLKKDDRVERADAPHIPNEVFAQREKYVDFMRTHAGWPRVISGEMEGSMATGKAIARLAGVSTGMNGLRQANIAADLSKCNEYAARMMEKFWPKKEFTLHSRAPIGPAMPNRPHNFTVSIVPERDIQGYYVNVLRYNPFGSDWLSTLTIAQQLVQSEIVSREWVMNYVPGVDDATGMKDAIKAERREKVDFEAELQQRLAQIEMEKQQQLAQQQAQAQAQVQGSQGGTPGSQSGTPAGPGGPPAGPGGQGGPALPPNIATLPQGAPMVMGEGQPLYGSPDNFPLPYQQITPFNAALDAMGNPQGAPAMSGPQEKVEPGSTSLDEVVQLLKGVKKLKGVVYVMGELASRGVTSGMIELGITVAADKGTITNALRNTSLYGRVKFQVVPADRVPADAVAVSAESGTIDKGQAQPQPETAGVA